MKTVTFKFNGSMGFECCCKPNRECDIDHSGEWVSASDADALERERDEWQRVAEREMEWRKKADGECDEALEKLDKLGDAHFAIARLEIERDEALALLRDGAEIVDAGVEHMTLDQLSRWSGVRGWLERARALLARMGR